MSWYALVLVPVFLFFFTRDDMDMAGVVLCTLIFSAPLEWVVMVFVNGLRH